MDTYSLTVLKAILAEGSFQKAAQRLNCSQSTVTFQVRQLENEFGLKLFERIGRNMVLSQSGRDILPHLDAILASMNAVMDYSNGQHEFIGELCIGAAESIISYMLPEILEKFITKAPKVRIELQSRNCHEIRNGIISGQYDIGIYYDVGGTPSSLLMTYLGKSEGVIVASPELYSFYWDFDTPNQEKDISFIIGEARSIYRERFEAHLRIKNIRLRNTIEVWSIEAIKKTVAKNMGISFLPYFAVEKELSSGELIEIPSDMHDRIVETICVHHRNRQISSPMQLFKHLLVDSSFFKSSKTEKG